MAVHLYGVTASAGPHPSEVKGRADVPVRLVGDDELSVIVSDIDAAAPAGRKDLMAHARVLESYVEQATVVPIQFGIALPDDDTVHEQVLKHDRQSLVELLHFFDGVVQLTVQASHHEQPALREVLRRDPGLLALRDQLQDTADPSNRDRQIELGQGVAEGLQQLQEEDATLILERLAPLAQAVSENDASGLREVLNAAFLVDRDSRPDFDAAVGALRELVEHRVRLRYVGPQPPYSFLEPARSGELAWG